MAGVLMGRIERRYPRLGEDCKAPVAPGQGRGDYASQALGALVGILAALGLIGWLLMR
jgi:hypothetical protein